MSDRELDAERPALDWEQVQHWFHIALEHPTDERNAFLARELRSQPQVHAEVVSLLAALDAEGSRFDSPLLDLTNVGDSTIAPGTDVGSWTVLRKIGEGGMATVYEAIRSDVDMPKRAALKTVRTIANASLRARFARERRILAGLEHPNIAALLDGGTLPDGRPWFAMEYVEGQRIDRWCVNRSLDVTARVRLLLQICRAVQAAHEQMVIHRDLKPTNILVTAEGTVKLLDFGIAKLTAETERHETATGALMMTADYASPEQLRGDPITTRTDVYSLGVVAFELLTGTRPFAMRGHGLRDLLRLADTEAPRMSLAVSALSAREAALPPQERLRTALSGDLEVIVAKALRKDATARYASAKEFADDLVAWLESRPVSAMPPTLTYRVRRLIRRNQRAFFAMFAFAWLAVIAVTSVTWLQRRAMAEEQRAAERLEEIRSLVRTLVFDVNDRLADVPGSTQLRANVVRTAVQSLDRASADGPRHPQLQRELALAYQRAGDLLGNPTQNNLGDSPGALSAYAKGISIAQEMVGKRPNDVNALWTLALTLEKLADVEAPSGELDDALAHQRESLSLFTRIARTDSANPEYLRAVGISALKLGDLLGHPAFTNKGQPEAAVSSYETAVAWLQAAAARGDTTYFTRRHQAVVQERLGRLQQERGDYTAARRWLRGSLDMRLGLERETPRSQQARRDVAIALYLLCGLHLAEKDIENAIGTCSRSLGIRESLLAEDPNNNVLVRGMGIMHRRMGEVRLAARDSVAALAELRTARRYYERFLNGRVGALNDRRDYSHLLLEFAEIASAASSSSVRREARVAYDAARVALDSIATVVPLTAQDSARLRAARARLVPEESER